MELSEPGCACCGSMRTSAAGRAGASENQDYVGLSGDTQDPTFGHVAAGGRWREFRQWRPRGRGTGGARLHRGALRLQPGGRRGAQRRAHAGRHQRLAALRQQPPTNAAPRQHHLHRGGDGGPRCACDPCRRHARLPAARRAAVAAHQRPHHPAPRAGPRAAARGGHGTHRARWTTTATRCAATTGCWSAPTACMPRCATSACARCCCAVARRPRMPPPLSMPRWKPAARTTPAAPSSMCWKFPRSARRNCSRRSRHCPSLPPPAPGSRIDGFLVHGLPVERPLQPAAARRATRPAARKWC